MRTCCCLHDWQQHEGAASLQVLIWCCCLLLQSPATAAQNAEASVALLETRLAAREEELAKVRDSAQVATPRADTVTYG